MWQIFVITQNHVNIIYAKIKWRDCGNWYKWRNYLNLHVMMGHKASGWCCQFMEKPLKTEHRMGWQLTLMWNVTKLTLIQSLKTEIFSLILFHLFIITLCHHFVTFIWTKHKLKTLNTKKMFPLSFLPRLCSRGWKLAQTES